MRQKIDEIINKTLSEEIANSTFNGYKVQQGDKFSTDSDAEMIVHKLDDILSKKFGTFLRIETFLQHPLQQNGAGLNKNIYISVYIYFKSSFIEISIFESIKKIIQMIVGDNIDIGIFRDGLVLRINCKNRISHKRMDTQLSNKDMASSPRINSYSYLDNPKSLPYI
jgi:hypothetical protein